jgi:hypothetical protein
MIPQEIRTAMTSKPTDLAEGELVEAGFEIVERDDDFILTECEECNRSDWLMVARISPAPGGGKSNFPVGR